MNLPGSIHLTTWIAAVWAFLGGSAVAATHYVDVNSTNPIAPYTSWETAATNISDATTAAALSDIIMVTNGVYSTPSSGASDSVALVRALQTVKSVNGPGFTVIQGHAFTNGQGAIRSVRMQSAYFMGDVTTLSGFTIRNGEVHGSINNGGGGVYCDNAITDAVITNCVITGNTADGVGGGVYGGTLIDCTLTENSGAGGGGAGLCNLVRCVISSNTASGSFGGGTYQCALTNCLVSGNHSGAYGGGAYQSTLVSCTVANNASGQEYFGIAKSVANNCIIYFNDYVVGTNSYDHNFDDLSTLDYCCTYPLPLPFQNLRSISNQPVFVDAARGDYHLNTNSPCINSGDNSSASNTTDLDGNARVAGGTVDMGAYEFQSPQSIVSYAWLQQYGFPTDGSSDFTDPDADSMNNWQEWKSGTIPTNGASLLQMFSPSNSVPGIMVRWQSVTNRTYSLQRSTNLVNGSGFVPIQSNLNGRDGTMSYTDSSAAGNGPYFYRVGVQ
jgi:hypothetical protein